MTCKEPPEYICVNTDQQEHMDLPRWQNSEALLRSTTNDDLQTVQNWKPRTTVEDTEERSEDYFPGREPVGM